MGNKILFLAALGATSIAEGSAASSSSLPIQLGVRSELTTRLANIHVQTSRQVNGPVTFSYGACTAQSQQDAHHVVSSTESGVRDSRLVWVIPEDAPSDGCISAWGEKGALVGRSKPQNLGQVIKKRDAKPIAMTQANGFDALGQWFDGVKVLKQKEPGPVDVKAAKGKNIGIVGAGLSGLMTYLVLNQAGFTNVNMIEASNRLGGRVHTEYLTGGPDDYSYQELGAMRLPVDYVDPESKKKYNISDTQLVFELIREMNKLNKDSADFKIELIDWIESDDNGLQYFGGIRLPNGLPPTVKQVADDPDLSPDAENDAETKATEKKLEDSLPGDEFLLQMAKSMYKAHREWNDKGLDGDEKGDRWSEFAYISQYLKGSLNSTDVLDQQQDPQGSFWEYMYDLLYESADSWATIDGGMSRLPQAFQPLVKDKIRFNTRIDRVKYDNKKVTLQYKNNFKDAKFQESVHDYAIISAPFTVVRQWRLPTIGATMKNAIKNLIYDSNCKVALEFKERFWEKMKNPIYGSCSTTTDIPGIAQFCYPSYNINSTGPASLLATYIDASSNHELARMQTMSEEEHVQYVVDAVAEIHGEETRKLFTGKYARKCWALDPTTAGAFANPSAGQHELYIPQYFQVHKNMIFIGEHTSYTHGWVSSALDSGIRGAVQMMLELGLVDEAKAAVKKWMVSWIKI
ncbi:hypothetical protein QQS21_000687 [Conoideocrella luteorostrata]|uniref:Amine oxidase domain-containing protein n=1 Tax=Conoideocrella luteorostrata TaxID=1105319 RepID=A0AAJ0FZ27_9HYPO|nr:hypothetical protein QQS21_000687 [Conoideocrella luteorostrata]